MKIAAFWTSRRRFDMIRVMQWRVILVLCIICLGLLASGVLDPVESLWLDMRFRLTPRPPVAPAICVIELDQKSVARIGEWPWPRSVHATLLRALHRAGARMIGFDILFSEKSGEREDADLAAAIGEKGNVYLPIAFGVPPAQAGPEDIIAPLGLFASRARGLGFINFSPDPDGVNRRVPLIIRCGDSTYPQLAFAMACELLGAGDRDITRAGGAAVILHPPTGPPLRIPLARGNAIVNWAGGWDTSFPRYSCSEVLDAYRGCAPGRPLPYPLDEFRDRICFVGLTAPGTFDSQPTPIEASYPNLGLHVNLLNSILTRRFVTRAGKAYEAALMVIVILSMSWLLPRLRPLRALFASGAVLVAVVVASYTLFYVGSLWLDSIYLFACVPLCYIVIVTTARISAAGEEERLWALVHKDQLTGVFLMRHFNGCLASALERRRGEGAVSLILMDIDGLKKVNDHYGREPGDLILRETASLIAGELDRDSVLARYEDDAFIIMLTGKAAVEAGALAERIRLAVAAREFICNGITHHVRISIGVADARGRSGQELISLADDAVYEAKERGGNRVCHRRSP